MSLKAAVTSYGMETAGILAVYRFHSAESLALYIFLHLLSSIFIASALKPFLPARFRRGSVRAFASLVFFTGPAGFMLLFMFYVLLVTKRIEILPLYENVSTEIMPDIEFGGRKAGESFGQVKNPKVVLYMSKTHHPLAVRYLREAISSDEDEVRLVAFATLSSMEKELMEKIGTLKAALDRGMNERERSSTHLALAELYWEIVYLNISDKELESFYLQESENHALKSLEAKEDARAHFLLGRLFLRKREIDRAEYHFGRAVDLGFPEERVVTYLMEVFYVKRDIRKLFELLDRYRDILPADHRTASILRVWT